MHRPRLVVALLLATLAAPAAWAVWVIYPALPVERLVANLTARLAEDPDDIQARYNLGRVHSFAFALEQRMVDCDDEGMPDGLELQRRRADLDPAVARQSIAQRQVQPLTDEELDRLVARGLPAQERLDHLREALRQLSRTLASLVERGALSPEAPAADPFSDAPPTEQQRLAGRVHLALSYVLEEGAHLATHVSSRQLLPDPTTVDLRYPGSPAPDSELEQAADALLSDRAAVRTGGLAELLPRLDDALPLLDQRRLSGSAEGHALVADLLARCWQRRAVAHALRAAELHSHFDLSYRRLAAYIEPLEDVVSYEATGRALRLLDGGRLDWPQEAQVLASLETLRLRVARVPTEGVVTPIILDLERDRPLAELLDEERSSFFDLAGDGVARVWPWVDAGTALLVWDPDRTATITSGRQLFGSATWWMGFADGYRALDSLDDDRNGWLRGPELAGLALWTDVDGDGLSGHQEVVSLQEAGVAALATRGAEPVPGGLTRPGGLLLADGRVLATHDWMPRPRATLPTVPARIRPVPVP